MLPTAPSDPHPALVESAISSLRDALAARCQSLAAWLSEIARAEPATGDSPSSGVGGQLGLREAERELLAEAARRERLPEDWRGWVIESIVLLSLWNEPRALGGAVHGPEREAALDAFTALVRELRGELEALADRTDYASRDVHEVLARALYRLERISEAIAAVRAGHAPTSVSNGDAGDPSVALPPEPGTRRVHPDAPPRKSTNEVAVRSTTTRVLSQPAAVATPRSLGRAARIGFATVASAAALVSLGYGFSASRSYFRDPEPAAITSQALEPFLPGARILPVTAGERSQKLVRIELSSDAAHAPPAELRERVLSLCKFLASTRYERAVIVDQFNRTVATWIEGRLEYEGAFAQPSPAAQR